ncbi:MAG: hypothetical protein ACK5PF_10235, partial [bacterium]
VVRTWWTSNKLNHHPSKLYEHFFHNAFALKNASVRVAETLQYHQSKAGWCCLEPRSCVLDGLAIKMPCI